MFDDSFGLDKLIIISSYIEAITDLLIEKNVFTMDEITAKYNKCKNRIDERDDIKLYKITDKLGRELLTDEEKDFFRKHWTKEEQETYGDCDKYINAMETFVKSKNEDGLDFGSALFRSLGSMF